MSVNKVILLGRLGQDPELKYTPSGMAVCNFSLATSENWVDKSGQRQEKTEWHRIQVWGKLGELCNQYLAKGRQAYVEGRLQTRSWDDQSGNKRYVTEITATIVQFIGGQQNVGAQPQQQQQQQRPSNTGYQQDNSYGQQQQQQAAPQSQNQNNSQDSGAMDQNYNVSTDINFTADDIPF